MPKTRPIHRITALCFIFFIATVISFAHDQVRRDALIIGNGAYPSNPDKHIFTGTLCALSTPSGARVEEGGKLLGTTPFKVELKPGEHTLAISWPAYGTRKFTATVQIGIQTVISLQGAYKIGDTGPAGGLVFYDKGCFSNGWRYLEAAPSDQSANIPWYNIDTITTGATATGIGSGKANTATIIYKHGLVTLKYAAVLCDDLVLGGYDDWFLPSKDELDLIYKNLKKQGRGGLTSGWYWSSSEAGHYVWVQIFENGIQGGSGKTYFRRVRAVRAF